MTTRTIPARLGAYVCLLLALAAPVSAQLTALSTSGEPIRARLVAPVDAVGPGTVFRVGVLFTIEARSHIYWRYPGDSGLATGIEWTLPDGFSPGAVQWPIPKRFEIPSIGDINYGYLKEVLLYVDVVAPLELKEGSTLAIKADPYWLLCKDSGECIPDGTALTLELTVGATKESKEASLFSRYGSRVPRILAVGNEECPLGHVESSAGRMELRAKKGWRFNGEGEGTEAGFFPNEGPPWDVKNSTDTPRGQTLTFQTTPKGKDGESSPFPGGVVSLPMKNEKTGRQQTFYYRLPREGS